MARRKRCSHCWTQGHTRPTCPKLKQEIRENPEGLHARRARSKARIKASRGPTVRRCSYCKEQGHNKKTCTTLTFDRVEYRVKNRKFNKAFIEVCVDLGFGPGALIELASPSDDVSGYRLQSIERERKYYGSLGMVVGFYERNLNSDLSNSDKYLGSSNQGTVRVRFPNGRTTIVPLPREFGHVATNSSECTNGFWKVGSSVKVDRTKFLSGFCAEWKDGIFSVNRQLGLED